MTRLQADLLLLLVALIWGAAFVAQKAAMAHMGAFTFIAARFAVSALIVLPLALREKSPAGAPKGQLLLLAPAFCAGVLLQQMGLEYTTVTNAGFLTGLYVLLVPVICFAFFRQKIPLRILPAALLAVAGVWMLSGMTTEIPGNKGDVLVILCAAGFALQVALVGRIMEKWKSPLRVCLLQYVAVTVAAFGLALAFETPSWEQVEAAIWPVLYGGVMSGGIAYTLQVVAQQYTPPSDSAVLMSGESLFAAFFGWLLMGDVLDAWGWTGCALLMAAILIVEAWPASKHVEQVKQDDDRDWEPQKP